MTVGEARRYKGDAYDDIKYKLLQSTELFCSTTGSRFQGSCLLLSAGQQPAACDFLVAANALSEQAPGPDRTGPDGGPDPSCTRTGRDEQHEQRATNSVAAGPSPR